MLQLAMDSQFLLQKAKKLHPKFLELALTLTHRLVSNLVKTLYTYVGYAHLQ